MFGLGLGLGIHRQSNANPYAFPFISRVESDGGITRDKAALLNLTYYLQSMMPNTKLLYCPELGVKLRTSGINNYVTELYDISSNMLDGTQTTALNQPYLSGNIAPTEKLKLKYLLNETSNKSIIFPSAISMLANSSWTLIFVLKPNVRKPYSVFNLHNLSTIEITGDNFRVYSDVSGAMIAQCSVSYLMPGISNIVQVTYNAGSVNVFINGIKMALTDFSTNEFTISKIQVKPIFPFDGELSFFGFFDRDIKESEVLSIHDYLRSLFPKIESVQIGSQAWATSNCEIISTPQGNVIQEMQASTNLEKIVNGGFDTDTSWTKSTDWTISGGAANCSGTSSTSFIRQFSILTLRKWCRVRVNVNKTSGTIFYIPGNSAPSPKSLINGLNEFYIFHDGATGDAVFLSQNFIGSIDNVSIEEVGWSDSTNLYNYIYTNTTGTAKQKEYAAVKVAAMWCHYNNDPALGAVYGKLYNWYAVKLLQMDIDYYNDANPTTPWGWKVPTIADFTTLSTYLGGDAVAGGKLKKEGFIYWGSPNLGATNESGFSAIGGGWRIKTGVFVETKYSCRLLTEPPRDIVLSNGNASLSNYGVVEDARGYSLRLIKA